jgi:hypothetical protein
MVRKPIAIALAVLSLSCAAPCVAAAAETVRVAVPDRGAWNTHVIHVIETVLLNSCLAS